tara:strand:+ start:3364 stop:3540 length:177 start_codon:yes stop_codon:yes gene_type:complete
MADVKANEDGSFTIEWDKEDPYESIFNDWTQEDFSNALKEYIQEKEEEERRNQSNKDS